MEFNRSVVGASTSYFIMLDEEKQPNDQKPEANQFAIDALTQFVSDYSPADSIATANFLYTTDEISQAIFSHTGQHLSASEIYKLMTDMNYKYNATSDLSFNWLLKKD